MAVIMARLMRKEVVLHSPAPGDRAYEQGEGVRRFSAWVDVPRSTSQHPVTVQVLDVQTSKAIKLLPAFEDPFMAVVESSLDNSFDSLTTDFAFLTINTLNFNLMLSYDEMFDNSLMPIDFNQKELWNDTLNQYTEGLRWFDLLYKAVFSKPKYFPSLDVFNGFKETLDQFYRQVLIPNKYTQWYTQVNVYVGPLFMKRKLPSFYNRSITFFKWL